MSENGNYHNNSAFEMQRFTMSATKPDVKLIDVNAIKENNK